MQLTNENFFLLKAFSCRDWANRPKGRFCCNFFPKLHRILFSECLIMARKLHRICVISFFTQPHTVTGVCISNIFQVQNSKRNQRNLYIELKSSKSLLRFQVESFNISSIRVFLKFFSLFDLVKRLKRLNQP